MRMKKRGIMKKGLILGLSCMMLGSTITITRAAENTKPLTDFGNVLDVTADPKEKIYGTYSTNEYNNFSDMGAWHGYYLHQKTATDLYGGFAGPVIIAEEYPINLSDSINKINLEKVTAQGNEKIDLTKATTNEVYYPGRLEQTYDLAELTLKLKLIFGTNRSALIETKIINKTNNDLKLNLSWDGHLFTWYTSENKSMGTTLSESADGVKVNFIEKRGTWEYMTTTENSFDVVLSEDDIKTTVSDDRLSYTITKNESITIGADSEYNTYQTQSFTFTNEERVSEKTKVTNLLKNPQKYFEKNNSRWQGYVDTIFENGVDANVNYQRAAVKSIETLMTNWFSAAGAIKHDGIVPSMSYKWFIGMWAVENVYRQTGDKEFLKEMYPKLAAYHNWWYTNRDIDKNGIAEYGGMVHETCYDWRNYEYTVGQYVEGFGTVNEDGYILDDNGERIVCPEAGIEAAAWESGMDNATRFDREGNGADDKGIEIYTVRNNQHAPIGYVINQESVDLNAYLYAEKGFLKSMAEELGYQNDVVKYTQEAQYIQEYINDRMYDEETGFYYDVQTNEDGSEKKLLVNRGKGTEGWIPLWAKAATKDKAARVVESMTDANKFDTFVPFPTASKDNNKYAPEKYWRGPVWLDQALYAVEALQNYGYYDEAKVATTKLFDHAKGLLGTGPIHENYNPETGEGLHTKNFSWSASAFYLLYQNTLTSTNTTSQTGFDIPNVNIEVNINKELLLEAIKKAELIKESEYTKDSYQGLVIALENGRAVYDDKNATQDMVDIAAAKLNEALNALVKIKITDNEGTSPKTGDSIETIGYAVLLGLTGGALALAGKRKKHN